MSKPENTSTRRKAKEKKCTTKQQNTRSMKINKKSDQIDKSQQLMQKTRKPKFTSTKKEINKLKKNTQHNVQRLPTLADLEIMFDESENNTNQTVLICDDRPCSEVQQSVIDITESTSCNLVISENSTAKRLYEDIDNNPRKELHEKRLHASIIIDSDLDYSSEDSDKNRPKKKQKIKDNETSENIDSKIIPFCIEATDNDVIVPYDVDIPRTGRFSPLPSTSRDSDTILENDLRFNASLTSNNMSQDTNTAQNMNTSTSQNMITSTLQEINTNTSQNINEIPMETILIDDEDNSIVYTNNHIQPKSKVPLSSVSASAPIIIDDNNSTGYLYEEAAINIRDLSIDEILSENTKVLNKYKPTRLSSAVIEVPSSLTKDLSKQKIHSRDNTNLNVMSRKQSYNNPISYEDMRLYDFNLNKNSPFGMCPCHRNCANKNNSIRRYTQAERNLCTFNMGERIYTYKKRNHGIPFVDDEFSDVIEIRTTNNCSSSKLSFSRNIGDCPICLEALSSKPICSTVCGHIFCMNCIKTSLKMSKKCPKCRKALRSSDYHQLFL